MVITELTRKANLFYCLSQLTNDLQEETVIFCCTDTPSYKVIVPAHQFSASEIEMAVSMLGEPKTSPIDQYHFCFALGKSFEDSKE